jgi:NAD(P)-dependent dehydrogenase (short-subunit alcohol dehydrogenase family)
MSATPGPSIAAIEPGLRVLVTAGAAGIGRTIAERLAGAGARLWVCDVDEGALRACGEARPDWGRSTCDVADPAAVERMMGDLAAAWGGLDVLVNNAGIAGPTRPVEEIGLEEWRRTIEVNLNGMFYCARLAVPHLKASRGAMINLSSIAGRLGYALRTPYAASKWAVVGLTRSLAKELGPHGVRVNAILPGVVAGPRIEGVIRARADAAGVPYEEMEGRYKRYSSLGRMVTADDIAATALFLCGPGGLNISGQALSVCGDVDSI